MLAGPGLTMSGRFTVAEEHQGAPGLVHGGVLAAAFDEVLGACNWLLLAPAVTGHLEVDFRKPVPVGRTVIIDAQVDAVDGRKVMTSGVGHFDDGTLVDDFLLVEAGQLREAETRGVPVYVLRNNTVSQIEQFAGGRPDYAENARGAAGDAGQEAASPGARSAGDRQRPRHPRRHSRAHVLPAGLRT